MKKKEIDLTRGSVPGGLVRFAVPLFFANLLQTCYSIVDMLVVGNFVGGSGLAAVSNAALIGYVIGQIGTGLAMGGTVLYARHRGAGEEERAAGVCGTLVSVTAIAAVLTTALSLAAYRPVLGLLDIPAEAREMADSYLWIMLTGTPFVFGYNAISGLMRGGGDSLRPLCFVGLATVCNVVLDVWFVGGLKLGTAGAALATVLSQAASFFAALWYAVRKRYFAGVTKRMLRPNRETLLEIVRIGLPSAVQLAVVNVSYLFVTALVNPYGVDAAAGAGVGLKLNTFAAMPCWAVGSAVTAMVGQNMGAGLAERVKSCVRAGLTLSLGVTAVCVAAVQIWAAPIVRLFDADAGAVCEGVRYLRVCCSFNSLVYAAMYILDAFATGAGNAKLAMINALIDSVAVRMLLCWALDQKFALAGVYWGQAVSAAIPLAVGLLYYFSGRWRKKTG